MTPPTSVEILKNQGCIDFSAFNVSCGTIFWIVECFLSNYSASRPRLCRYRFQPSMEAKPTTQTFLNVRIMRTDKGLKDTGTEHHYTDIYVYKVGVTANNKPKNNRVEEKSACEFLMHSSPLFEGLKVLQEIHAKETSS